MIRYYLLMYFLLGLAGLTALFVLRNTPQNVVVFCGGPATYPVSRLADSQDVGAMAYLGEKLVEPACTPAERVRGAGYLAEAADAGHPEAMFVLGQIKLAEDDARNGLALIRQSAAAGHVVARAYLTSRAAPRDGGRTACLGLLAMHYPFEDDADHLSSACD